MSIALQNEVVYGPIQSRRLGTSLGINILPLDAKFCLSNCIYCQYGWTDLERMRLSPLPRKEELLTEIKRRFVEISRQGISIDSITFCGNGEPTLHPELGEILHETQRMRDHFLPGTDIGILSDSSRVHLKGIRKILDQFDHRYMKWDAGSELIYMRLNQPWAPVDWYRLRDGLSELRNVSLQALFVQGPVNNADGDAYEKWLNSVKVIAPKEVYVYTVDRPPADPEVKPVSHEQLEAIRNEITEFLKIKAYVYDEITHHPSHT